MKKIKNLIAVILIMLIVFSCSMLLGTNKAYAVRYVERPIGLFVSSSNEYEFNSEELLAVYADNSAEDPCVLRYRMDVTGKEAVLVTNNWGDGLIDGRDSTNILEISQGIQERANTNAVIDARNVIFSTALDEVISSLAEEKNISKNDISATVKVKLPKINGYNETEDSYTISSDTRITQEILDKINAFEAVNQQIINDVLSGGERDLRYINQLLVSVTLNTASGEEWKLVVATDDNFYLVKTEEIPALGEFDTTLEYDVTVEDVKGKMDGNTFLPPYFDNDNNKKDSDAIAIIKSKTKEEIKSTNGVDLRNDEKPNSEGWYYPEVEDKTVIAKEYKFDEYDNTTYNGIVKETVKLTGSEGGEDTQAPSIKWTFRRKIKTEKENADGSVTVTIIYNLPVDPESIPDGWSPVYDSDGKTIHAIEKTIKKGEDYDKDVIVKQNGTDATVTTPVSKKWPKEKSQADNLGPQAGTFTIVLAIVILGAIVFAITRYRKLNK